MYYFSSAFHLAASGLFSSVLLGCRDSTRGQQAVADIQAQGKGKIAPTTEIKHLPLTVGDAASHEQFRKAVEEQYGKLDCLVNNAGFAFKGADPTPFAQQCKPTIDINFRGTVDLTETLLPLLRKGTDARIVNVASMSGHLSQLRSAELRNQFTSQTLTMDELRELVDQFETDVLAGKHTEKGWGNSNYGMSKLALHCSHKGNGARGGEKWNQGELLLPWLLRHGHDQPPRFQTAQRGCSERSATSDDGEMSIG